MPNDASDWARICRAQAAWATDSVTRSLLLELAANYDELASAPADEGTAAPASGHPSSKRAV